MKNRGILDWIIDTMAFIAGLLLVATVLIESLEIFMRYFVKRPQVWSMEACEYILFGIAFLGAPWLLKRGGHVSVDILVERLSLKSKSFLGLLSTGIGMFVSALICWFGLVTSWDCYITGVVVTKTFSIPKHYFLPFISLGYFFLLIEFGRQFFRNLIGAKEGN
jgi:TRAP-type C4-dicarboxylate transport system permease small subunit